MSSSIKDKDKKILWGRSAGRCSFPDCCISLTAETECQAVNILGEMCHIVGEKETAPRGRSPLTIDQRNSYENLILLCPNHHITIDKDEFKYTVEALIEIKSVHENWFKENYPGSDVSSDKVVYIELINAVVQALYLNKWESFIDSAVRDLLPEKVLDFRGTLNRRLLSTLFPEKKPKLEAAIKTVICAYSEYVTHFESRSEFKENGSFLGRDLSYRRLSNPDYESEVEAENYWSQKNFWLLCNLTFRLNNFCDAVREFLDPMFYREYGHFLIIDSLGYRFNGCPTDYKPIQRDIEDALVRFTRL